jgi:hypothetical protein
VPRALVELGDAREPEKPTDSQQTKNDRDLWNAMDKAAEEVAKVFNGGTLPEVLSNARDGMGTTTTRPARYGWVKTWRSR